MLTNLVYLNELSQLKILLQESEDLSHIHGQGDEEPKIKVTLQNYIFVHLYTTFQKN
jgi:hypothetical protein